MNIKNMKIPLIILVAGLVASVIACLLTGVIKNPVITEQDFDFSVKYTLDGQTKTFEGTYRCEFEGHGGGVEAGDRFYYGYFLNDESTTHPGAFTIAQDGKFDLCIVVTLSNYYLMGDYDEDDCHEDPYLAVFDNEGTYCGDITEFASFNAEIVDWEYPEPIENTIVFGGFSLLHEGSMAAMVLVGALVIIACMIFVKRDETVTYNLLDKLSIVLNFLVIFVAVPLISMIVALLQITMSGDELIYQVFLCVPPFTTFAVAASIVMRRKGFTKTGFFIQLIGPAAFALYIIIEAAIYNLFS